MSQLKEAYHLDQDSIISEDITTVDEGLEAGVLQTTPRSQSREQFESLRAPQKGPNATLFSQLNILAELIANVTEAYTAAIFVADPVNKLLRLGGLQTLSRDFLVSTEIPFGSGLIGWTAENAVRISVCPFEHDSTTLLCYSQDQALKSFIAVPILGKRRELLGVISCDSKKNYAFAKVTEKILLDCAKQAAMIIELNQELGLATRTRTEPLPELPTLLEKLREYSSENSLLASVASIPQSIIRRDALVVITTADGGVGRGAYYSNSKENRTEHRLLELVCKHKRVICGERSIQALPTDDIRQRSFLSVPFHILNREAGSLNLLSEPHETFDVSQIAALEKIAQVIGKELERIRLANTLAATHDLTGIFSWKQFAIQAESLLEDAAKERAKLTLLRISLTNIREIELISGPEVAALVQKRIMRIVEQVRRAPAVACYLYGSEILLLTERDEADRSVKRIMSLVERLSISDIIPNLMSTGLKLGAVINHGMQFSHAHYPDDGQTLQSLTAKSAERLQLESTPQEVVQNVGNWA